MARLRQLPTVATAQTHDVTALIAHADDANAGRTALNLYRDIWNAQHTTRITSALEGTLPPTTVTCLRDHFESIYLKPASDNRNLSASIRFILSRSCAWHVDLFDNCLRLYALLGEGGLTRTFLLAFRDLAGISNMNTQDAQHQRLSLEQAMLFLDRAARKRHDGGYEMKNLRSTAEWQPLDCQTAGELAVTELRMQWPAKRLSKKKPPKHPKGTNDDTEGPTLPTRAAKSPQNESPSEISRGRNTRRQVLRQSSPEVGRDAVRALSDHSPLPEPDEEDFTARNDSSPTCFGRAQWGGSRDERCDENECGEERGVGERAADMINPSSPETSSSDWESEPDTNIDRTLLPGETHAQQSSPLQLTYQSENMPPSAKRRCVGSESDPDATRAPLPKPHTTDHQSIIIQAREFVNNFCSVLDAKATKELHDLASGGLLERCVAVRLESDNWLVLLIPPLSEVTGWVVAVVKLNGGEIDMYSSAPSTAQPEMLELSTPILSNLPHRRDLPISPSFLDLPRIPHAFNDDMQNFYACLAVATTLVARCALPAQILPGAWRSAMAVSQDSERRISGLQRLVELPHFELSGSDPILPEASGALDLIHEALALCKTKCQDLADRIADIDAFVVHVQHIRDCVDAAVGEAKKAENHRSEGRGSVEKAISKWEARKSEEEPGTPDFLLAETRLLSLRKELETFEERHVTYSSLLQIKTWADVVAGDARAMIKATKKEQADLIRAIEESLCAGLTWVRSAGM